MFGVVVHTPDVVGERMAGPGIRAWHFAAELARHFTTTLVCKREGELPAPVDFRVGERGSAEALVAMRAASVVIGQPARGFGRQRRGQRVVYDLFDPVLLELREMYGRHPSMRQRVHLGAERFVAMHWGTYQLTDEPLDEPPQRLRAEWARRSLDPWRLHVPAVGESIELRKER